MASFASTKWKYKNPKEKTRGAYLYFNDDEEKLLSVTDWDFKKGAGGYLFKCYVTSENGEKVDKIWTVFDFKSMVQLKKKLGTKSSGTKEVKVKMFRDDKDYACFEIS